LLLFGCIPLHFLRCCSEELNRPENAYLKPLAQRVKDAKAAVDAAVDPKGEKISYADLLVLATKVATVQAWKDVKVRLTPDSDYYDDCSDCCC
jgi:hypothetical protein